MFAESEDDEEAIKSTQNQDPLVFMWKKLANVNPNDENKITQKPQVLKDI